METTQTVKGRLSGKYKRIGQKVGNVVAIMLALSIVISVAVCAYLFHGLMVRTLGYEASLSAAARGTGIVLLLALVIAIIEIAVCILVLTAYLKNQVSRPLAEISQVAMRLEQGDLGLSRGEDVQVPPRQR